jgi:small-conductance mechanosensitive channel
LMHSDLYLIIGSAVIVAVTFAAAEIVGFVLKRAARIAGAGPTVSRDIAAFVRIIALVIMASGVLNFTGLASDFTALTISGVAALALSLALQTTLSNVICGLLIFNDGVIRLGDTIEYSGVKGKVARMALRNVWIKLDDGSIAVVSNSSLSGGPVINHSAADRLAKRYALD